MLQLQNTGNMMENKDIYTGDEYISRNPTYHEEDSLWKAERIFELLSTAGITPSSVCEVGCGAGGILAALQKKLPDGTKLHGYEIAPRAYEICRKKTNANLTFTLGDITAMETPVFDLLLCIDVIEHIDDINGFLQKIRNKAEYKLFNIPVEKSLYKNLIPGRLEVSREKYGHIHFFTRRSAEALLSQNGFNIILSRLIPIGVACSTGLDARLGRYPVKLISAISDSLSAVLFGAHSLLVVCR